MSALRAALAAFVVFACASCSSEDDAPPPPPPPTPPEFVTLDVPDWPPIGRDASVEVRLSDDEALSRITATFKDVSRKVVAGRSGLVRFTGDDLGEGMGTLTLVACDARDACRERRVQNLLVDMTPPEIEIERAVVSPLREGIDGQVGLWVMDEWVLGSVDVTFQGKTVHRDFPNAFPSTLGSDWDISRIGVPAGELPEGDGQVTVVARDAAGNAHSAQFALRIDATRPVVAFTEPAAEQTVSGALSVRVTASDDSKVAPNVELWVGGARVYDATAPDAPLVIDTSTLPPGPTELRAIARDEAGNTSAVAKVGVTVTR